jgi:hypothetical protein
MNTLGFSKNKREIHRHDIQLQIALSNMFHPANKLAMTMTGSASEGMYGGIYGMESHHDSVFLFKDSNIKLYTPLTNNINNLTLLHLHDNEDYDASFLSKKMTTFQDMSNYHWRKKKQLCLFYENV